MADGTVQAFSFILTADVALDASALLSNTDWFVRSQSTNGGGGSAKTTGAIGTIPSCKFVCALTISWWGCCLLLLQLLALHILEAIVCVEWK